MIALSQKDKGKADVVRSWDGMLSLRRKPAPTDGGTDVAVDEFHGLIGEDVRFVQHSDDEFHRPKH